MPEANCAEMAGTNQRAATQMGPGHCTNQIQDSEKL